jgi:hypothetical protein
MPLTIGENILPLFLSLGVPYEDLPALVQRHFRHSQHQPGTDNVLYPGEPYALKLIYKDDGILQAAEVGSVLTEGDFEAISTMIRSEYPADCPQGIGGAVLFSNAPIQGWWRYRDVFQMLPLPDSAPKPSFLVAEQPFNLEFSYSKVTDGHVNIQRRSRQTRKLELLLHVLLRPAINNPYFKFIGTDGWAWVLPRPDEDSTVSAYCPKLYTFPDLVVAPDSFSDVGSIQPMVLLDPQTYYAEIGISSAGFKAPRDLEDCFDHFFALPPQIQEKFLHACVWFRSMTDTKSFSLMYLAAIQAIETLMPPEEGGHGRCSECGKKQAPGPTARMKAFVEEFAPTGNGESEVRSHLYKIRSDLTHGYRPPFRVDREIRIDLNPQNASDRDALTEAAKTARIVLRNWLMSDRPRVTDDRGESRPLQSQTIQV